MWYRGVVGKGRQKVLPEKRIIFGGELVTHCRLIFIPLLLLLQSYQYWSMRKLFQGNRIKVYVSWSHSPLVSTALLPERACMRNSREYKAATMVVYPKSNSRLLVDSTLIWLANGACCSESSPLFKALRHRAPSSPIYLSEVIHEPFTLSRVFLLSSGGKSVLLGKKKRLHVVVFLCLCT